MLVVSGVEEGVIAGGGETPSMSRWIVQVCVSPTQRGPTENEGSKPSGPGVKGVMSQPRSMYF